MPRSKPDAKTVVVSFLSKKEKKSEELTLAELHVEKHLHRGRWQSRSEPDRGGGAHQQRKQRSLSRRAASSWILLCSCGLEPPDAPPPSVCLACEILHCRCLREHTLKSRNVLQKKKTTLTSNKQEIVLTPLLLLYSKIYSVTFSWNPYMFSVLAWK